MIKKLTIQNFQSHASSILQLHKGVNIIVGTSDSGKSAILRALRWVINGKPKGDAMCSWWGGETKIKIKFDNCTVIRKKEKSNNSFILKPIEGKSTVFKAFGGDIPQEIEKAINLSNINIQKQLDKPFLLDDSPGEVAAHFNQIANLEKIDKSIKYITSEIRNTTQQLSLNKNTTEEVKIQITEYNWIELAEKDILILDKLENKKLENKNKIDDIEELISDIVNIENKLNTFLYIEKADKLVIDIEQLLEHKHTVETKLYNLIELDKVICIIENKINTGEKYMSALPVLENIFGLQNTIDENTKIINNMTNIIKDMDKIEKQIGSTLNEISNDENIYTANMPKVCPFCDAKIKHKHIN